LHVNHLLRPNSFSTFTKHEWAEKTITELGFVQIDPISAVEKAHYHILYSRNSRFEKEWLTQSLEQERTTFENWTHDASILPSNSWPYWKHYFERFKNFEIHKGYKTYFEPLTSASIDKVLNHIASEGPSKPSDIESKVIHWNDAYFSKSSLAKITSEYLWRTGKLAIHGRQGNTKIYDLSERIIPPDHFNADISNEDYVDWSCRKALQQLGIGSPVHMAGFMHAISKEQALEWCESHRDEVDSIQVEYADGTLSRPLYALCSSLNSLNDIPEPSKSLRLLNPFDPLIHDRQRTSRIFGFDFTIEIWVPAAKRKYGYYVLPILEGDRFVGRIDLKTDRKAKQLKVLGHWWEKGVRSSKKRHKDLNKELDKLAKFTGVHDLNWLH
jgi:uncharacterized protein YcaQ